MKAKYLFVYIALGAAFLAVSLWVFLSNGKSARAVRTKYRLGGAMLTTWALLSASTCNGPLTPEVTCYDPVAPTNELSIGSKNGAVAAAFSNGDVLAVTIYSPTTDKFEWKITDSEQKNVLQSGTFTVTEEMRRTGALDFEVTLSVGSWKGKACFVLSALYEGMDPQVVAGQHFDIQ